LFSSDIRKNERVCVVYYVTKETHRLSVCVGLERQADREERRRKQPARPRRREGGKGSGALGEQRGGWRRSANTTAAGAGARTAGARASASITAAGATAGTVTVTSSTNTLPVNRQ